MYSFFDQRESEFLARENLAILVTRLIALAEDEAGHPLTDSEKITALTRRGLAQA